MKDLEILQDASANGRHSAEITNEIGNVYRGSDLVEACMQAYLDELNDENILTLKELLADELGYREQAGPLARA